MKRLIIITIAVMMCMPVLSFGTGADEGAGGVEISSRQGVDLTDISGGAFSSTKYPGDTESFYLRVQTVYDGSYYNGAMAPPWNYQYLFDTNFTIVGLVDTNYNPVAGAPIEWTSRNVNDNGGNGWDMNSPGSWYNIYDENWNYFEFKVSVDNIETGSYYIKVTTNAKVIVDWNGVVDTFDTHTDVSYISLDIDSPIGFSSFSGLNDFGSTEAVYAGADNERFGMNIYSISGTITDINAKLVISDNRISVRDPMAYSNGIVGGFDLLWFIDVADATPTGRYKCEITFDYTRNGDQVTEALPMIQDLIVQWTPLLEFPDSNGFTQPLHTFVQNTPTEDFTIPILNNGNVDLEGVTVRLDMDRASYFTNGEFYYNEANWAQVTYEDSTSDLGDIAKGDTKEATFSDIILKDNLPPGNYKIPLDYIGSYYDNGTLGSSDMVQTGYWDEKNHYEYQTIHLAADNPQPTSPFYPFIFVQIVDDAIGLDISGQVNTVYTPGQRNRYVSMQVFNNERYSFTSANYWVHADGGSPFKKVASPDSDTSATLPSVYGGTLSGSSYDYIYFYADIRQDLQPGTHVVQVDMEAYNPQSRLIQHSFDAIVVIGALTPTIQSMNTEVNVTNAGVGTVTVTLKNVGFGGAHNLTLFFESTYSSVKSTDPPINVGDLLPGDSVDYKFKVRPTSESQKIWGTFSGNVYFEYVDDGGALRTLFSSGSEYITYTFQPKLPDFRIVNVNAPGIKPGREFTVDLDIANIGGSTAMGTNVMFVSNTGLFTVMGKTSFDLGDIKAGESSNISLTIMPSKALDDGITYSLYLYFSFQRIDGFGLTFSEGDHESFSVRTIDSIPVNRQEQVVEYKNAGQNVDWGMVILGIFIFLSVVVGITLYNKKQGPKDPFTDAPMVRSSEPEPVPIANSSSDKPIPPPPPR